MFKHVRLKDSEIFGAGIIPLGNVQLEDHAYHARLQVPCSTREDATAALIAFLRTEEELRRQHEAGMYSGKGNVSVGDRPLLKPERNR